MKTKNELLKAQAAELAKFEQEQKILALLPEQYRESATVCIHRDHASVGLWHDSEAEEIECCKNRKH